MQHILLSITLVALTLCAALSCHSPAPLIAEDRDRAGPVESLLEIQKRSVNEFISLLDSLVPFRKDDPLPLNTFEQVRAKFKQFEYLLEYTDKEWHTLFNGPPVAKTISGLPANSVMEPSGLQVLEEMLCEGIPDPAAWHAVIRELGYQADLWADRTDQLRLDRMAWLEAVMIHLVRLETLSLAGFDRPCLSSSDVIYEIRSSLNAIGIVLYALFPEEDFAKELLAMDDILKQSGTLEDLPSAGFIREHIMPLRARMAAQYTTGDRPERPPKPFRLSATSIYDPDFLDASFYSIYGIGLNDERQRMRKELGQRLFFDPVLSGSGDMSCATCHQPGLAFTDGLPLSITNQPGQFLSRNTPTLVHAAYQAAYMYDSRSASLEEQVLHVFTNEMEFHTHVAAITGRLSADSSYSALFETAYPSMKPAYINLHSLTNALAAFIRSLTGHNSPFDRYMRGETNELPEAALNGFQLFMTRGKCATCHFPPTFSGLTPPYFTESESENIGTPLVDEWGNWQIDGDQGRYVFFQHEAFLHFFKTPTVRNAEHTAPYMHNGVFASLDEVMDFYNNGGGVGHGLAYDNQTLPPDSLFLSPEEISDLQAFIHSLTDLSAAAGTTY
jgi:cytochrome c peroxidase